jgi:hypothetical protein
MVEGRRLKVEARILNVKTIICESVANKSEAN